MRSWGRGIREGIVLYVHVHLEGAMGGLSCQHICIRMVFGRCCTMSMALRDKNWV